jgi:hypothetical protein
MRNWLKPVGGQSIPESDFNFYWRSISPHVREGKTMKRIPMLFSVVLLAFTGLLLAGHGLSIQSAAATTTVCGQITSNVTWTAAGGPYSVCASTGVTVMPGVTLTIQPGTTVQFEAGPSNTPGNKLYVSGSLVASGSPTQTVTFTGVNATKGSWAGISADGTLIAPAQIALNYVTLDYGGVSGSYGAGVYADHANMTINHSLIENGAGNGLYTTQNTHFDVHDTSFVGNGQNAIQLNQPKVDLTMSGLSAIGNGTDAIRLAGPAGTPINGQREWSNPGIPYLVDTPIGNQVGDVLTIEAGSELVFSGQGYLSISGELKAVGTPSNPITLTAQVKSPGAWRGIQAYGGTQAALVDLDYVTIEYGGSDINGANIALQNAMLVAHHSTIRYSMRDGVRFDPSGRGSLIDGQVYGNAQYGVRNTQPNWAALATNDYWGAASGPQSVVTGCSSGQGDKVTSGVLFVPVAASANASVLLPLSAYPNLTMTPRRWFAPADGTTRVYFDLTLLDGNGAPIPGRTVKLSSSLGNVTDGGVTDLNGHTLAYLTSSSSGDANVSASLEATSACEGALSPTAKISFIQPINVTDLFPNSPAPYLSNDISVTPLPVISGVTTTIHATLNNPLNQPITVDVSFEYAQAGVGLTFGPIKNISGLVVPAKGSVPLEAAFIPPISGHYCAQVSYTITAIGATEVQAPLDGGSGMKQFNWNANPGPPMPPKSKESLDKADKAFRQVNRIPSGPTQVQKAVVGGWWNWVKDAAKKISQALGLDPPRQDYTTVTLPVRHTFPPVQPGPNISAARAAAFNAVSDALLDVEAYATAEDTALDRYGGASEANDLLWASEQVNEMTYYQQQLGNALLVYADSLDNFVSVLKAEGETQTVISLADVTSYQARLASSGFTAQEIADAKQAGLTDEDIEALRQDIITSDPAELTGDWLDKYTQEAADMREVGNDLLHPELFNPGFSVSGGGGGSPQASGNVMAQIQNTSETIQVSNPLTHTATINLETRRIDLPADWAVSVAPAQVSLAPGEQVTATITIAAGAPLPQGSLPTIAVEGYSGSQLLGGVTIQVVVPKYRVFDGKLHLYLPMLR